MGFLFVFFFFFGARLGYNRVGIMRGGQIEMAVSDIDASSKGRSD